MNSLFDPDKSLMYLTKTFPLACYISQKHTAAILQVGFSLQKNKSIPSSQQIGGKIKEFSYSKPRKVIFEQDHVGVFPSNTTGTGFQMIIISIVLN